MAILAELPTENKLPVITESNGNIQSRIVLLVEENLLVNVNCLLVLMPVKVDRCQTQLIFSVLFDKKGLG